MKWCYYFSKGGGVIAFYFFNSQRITHFWNDDLLCSIKNKLHSFALHAHAPDFKEMLSKAMFCQPSFASMMSCRPLTAGKSKDLVCQEL